MNDIGEDGGSTNYTGVVGTETAECAAMKRKERRKAAKKEKRKNKRKEIAETARREEEIRLNDPEEQRRLQAEEEQERLRLEAERRRFEEMEKKILEAWERKKALEEEEEEEERRRRAEQQQLLSQQNQVEHENEVDDDGWEYVEEGPSEIIWQGNEIIVRKKKIRVKKKDADQKITKEDPNRPTSNPLPPQSEAFTDHKNVSALSAQQLLDTVAQETPNFGTEQDKAHCPFHLKTGACRFGSRCSRIHFYPDKSCTLLIKNMYSGPGLAWEQDEGLEYTDEETDRAFEDFYEDVHTEFLKFGEIINFKVCRNGSSHLRGNVYVHYKSLDSAVLSYQSVNGRYFAGKQLQCEFVGVTRWRVAICGEFMKSKLTTCSRGTACNFIHCFRNPGGDYEWADWDKPPPKYWVKEMEALFGYSDESGFHKKTEQGSPRSVSSTRSLSRKTEYSSCSRTYSGDDYRSSESRRHSRSSDRKHADKLDYELHGDKSNSREKQHSRNASIDHDSYRYWSDMDGVRQSHSSNLSPACRKRKLEPRDDRGDEANHETDPDENMHENDLDSYRHERSRRSRRHREKQGHRSGSKGDWRIEEELGPSNQSGMARAPRQQKKRSTSPMSDSCEEFEHRKKRRYTHKLNNSSNWDNSDRGNEEVEQGDESLRDSRQNYTTSDCSSKYYPRKEKQGAENGASTGEIRVQREKPERKRGTSDVDDERGRWEA